MPPILLGTILSLIFLIFHSVKAGSNYVDLQAASSIAPGWIADGATNNNGGQILAPFSNEQISESLFTSDNACASPDKSQTHVRRGRRRGRRGAICPNLAPSPLQGTEQDQQQPNGKLGDGNTDSSTESFQSPNPGSQQPSGKVPAWPKIEPNREKCDHDSINIPVCDSMQNSEVAATSSSVVLYNLPKCNLYNPFDACDDPYMIWCCHFVYPNWLGPHFSWNEFLSYDGWHCVPQKDLQYLPKG